MKSKKKSQKRTSRNVFSGQGSGWAPYYMLSLESSTLSGYRLYRGLDKYYDSKMLYRRA